ncbi:MAG: hypothetical protein IPH52_19750 [Leptospiraceae bacterium]|nr:hypothetical protein [Leptospiraceae bacterium]
MIKLLILSIFPILLSCGKIAEESNNSVFQNISLMLFRNSKLTVSGTAVKGIVKNGIVVVNPLNADGTCNTAKVLSSGTTDGNGDYSLTYFKTGSFACLTILGDPSGNTKMFDEKENADIALASSSSFKLVKIIDESKITNNNQKIIASPFSTMHSRRLQALMKQSGSTDMAALNKKASKEVVIRFGLSSGLSSASARATTTSLNDKDYPELDDLALDLKNPSDLLTAKNLSVMAGISYLANKTKAGTKTTPEDINSVINAFATDFEDGIFDGKGSDGNAIKIGTGASQIIFSSTPLTTTLLPAITSYIQEGGSLSAGILGTSPATITTAQVTSQMQFLDNTAIIVDTPTTTTTTTTPAVPGVYLDSPNSTEFSGMEVSHLCKRSFCCCGQWHSSSNFTRRDYLDRSNNAKFCSLVVSHLWKWRFCGSSRWNFFKHCCSYFPGRDHMDIPNFAEFALLELGYIWEWSFCSSGYSQLCCRHLA